jgi:hypothetical protein
MIIRVIWAVLLSLLCVAPAAAQGVILDLNQDGGYVEFGAMYNRYGSGGGVGFGMTRGCLDFGGELSFLDSYSSGNVGVAQVAGIDLRRLISVDMPVTLQLREAVGVQTGNNFVLVWGPAMYLRGVDPKGGFFVVGGGLSILQGLDGDVVSGQTQTTCDASATVGYRAKANSYALTGSASFDDEVTTYFIGININFFEAKKEAWGEGESWD